MANHTIQQATKNDLADILQLQKKAFAPVAKLMGNDQIQPLQQTLNEIAAEYNKDTILTCISPQGTLIGSIRAYLDDGATCHIGKLIVHPDHQNQGIGKTLLDAIEKHYPTCQKFSLFTVIETPNTAYLYQKVGYHTVSTHSMDNITLLTMEKENTHPTQV